MGAMADRELHKPPRRVGSGLLDIAGELLVVLALGAQDVGPRHPAPRRLARRRGWVKVLIGWGTIRDIAQRSLASKSSGGGSGTGGGICQPCPLVVAACW